MQNTCHTDLLDTVCPKWYSNLCFGEGGGGGEAIAISVKMQDIPRKFYNCSKHLVSFVCWWAAVDHVSQY